MRPALPRERSDIYPLRLFPRNLTGDVERLVVRPPSRRAHLQLAAFRLCTRPPSRM